MTNPRVVVLVQARIGSSRLPGKALLPVGGMPLLLFQLARIRRARTVHETVVITTRSPSDDPVAALCHEHGIPVYRGHETDLLDRHVQAAREFQADFVAKIPSDCPLADPILIDQVLSLWLNDPDRYDYVSNYHPPSFPDGLDVEGSPLSILETAWRESTRALDREHSFPFIWDRPDRFRIGNIENSRGNMFLTHRWTLDYPEDLEFIRRVIDSFPGRNDFGTDEILDLLARDPEIARINARRAGINWYRHHPGQLKTVRRCDYRTDTPAVFPRSLALLERAKKVIPCATQTLSKGYTQWSPGAAPQFLESARGCEVTDVDGNVYIDYGMALGPYILGYADPDVDAAVARQLGKGVTFTLPHPLEVEAAELITEVVPCAEMVRFGKNGSDVTSTAVKLARAHTGREKIVICGYHGWQDWYIASTERNKGIPASTRNLVLPMEYNNLNSLRRLLDENRDEIAGVILEPVYVTPPIEGFLEGVRALTTEHGIVLIFDELFTGFRWAMGGAQEYFGVTPDLACFGKAVANGMPVSILAGRRAVMLELEEVFFSSTFGGEALSLAALVATIDKLKSARVHEAVAEKGAYLKCGVEALIHKHGLENRLAIFGYPFKTAFNFNPPPGITGLEMKTFFQQECAQRGVLFIGYHLCSLAHTRDHLDFTIRIYDEVMGLLVEALASGTLRDKLRGPVLEAIFKNVGDRSSGMAAASQEVIRAR